VTQWNVNGFRAFYAALHPGREPFAWQLRLADSLLTTGRWPEYIDAPTGSGKTCVIDLHVYAVAAMAGGGIRVPRRLSVVVDRRALVDSQEFYSRDLLARLSDGSSSVLRPVAEALRSFRGGGAETQPLDITVLRGGVPVTQGWLDDPVAGQILLATPDMWGSRLLFRPYGSSMLSAPRSAGLLAYDSVVIIDEAHIARQFSLMARSVAHIAAMHADVLDVPSLNVVEMTATQATQEGDPRADTIGVSPADLDMEVSNALGRRLRRPKPVTYRALTGWDGTHRSVSVAASMIAETAIALRKAHGGTVACVVNTIATATAVMKDLSEALGHKWTGDREPAAQASPVQLLVGRLRPFDVDSLGQQYPGLFSAQSDSGLDYLVATQTVEVGVDADFTALVTELAPAEALVQRAGRVNRLGARASGPVVVVGFDALPKSERIGPYQRDDLVRARRWIEEISADPAGLGWEAIRKGGVPQTTPRRPAFHEVAMWDALSLASTHPEQFARPDLDLWLSDGFDQETDVGVVVRRGLTGDAQVDLPLIQATPPLPHEVFPVRMWEFRAWTEGAGEGEPAPVVVRCSAGEEPAMVDTAVKGWLAPGDVFIIKDSARAFTEKVFTSKHPQQFAHDVYEQITTDALRPSGGDGKSRARLDDRFIVEGALLTAAIWADLAELDIVEPTPADVIESICRLRPLIAPHKDGDHDGFAQAIVILDSLLTPGQNDRSEDVEVRWPPTASGEAPPWIVILGTVELRGDEEVRQTWSPSSGRVLLDNHARDVAERAHQLARKLNLPTALQQSLRAAGALHDEGKRDGRFQQALGATSETPDLAKSGIRSPGRVRQLYQAAGLHGWRHEQRSAAVARAQLKGASADADGDGDASAVDDELVVRLVGTSHGRGRPTFRDDADALLGGSLADPATRLAAEELFNVGEWEETIESTQRRYGVWGVAFLEALVRAADGQVSGEGK
jgi:CRISPR-associated endonuclease/helicase Cas3